MISREITPSFTSSKNDFDFLQGVWNVQNRKLKTRLNNCTDWDEFPSVLKMQKVLTGLGNVENYYATFNGEAFEGMAIRLFDETTKLWKIYWVDSNTCKMDENPVTGSFENSVGKFYAWDTFNGTAIKILYQWDATDADKPIWSQAFSQDEGNTWEWNWEMHFTKIN